MSKVEELEKKLAQAKARLNDAKNRERAAQRKADARRKVILGGALLALFREKPSLEAQLMPHLNRLITRAADRAALGLDSSKTPEN